MPKTAGKGDAAAPATATRRRTVVTREEFDEPANLENPPKPTFWEFMGTTTEESWNQHNTYCQLYRVDPRLGKRLADGFLEKFTRPFSIDEIKRIYGGCDFEPGVKGHYASLVTSDGKIAYGQSDGAFYIEGPPKYPNQNQVTGSAPGSPGTVSTERELLDYLKKRDERIDKLIEERTQQQPAANPAALMAPVLDVMSTAAKKGMEIATGGAPAKEDELHKEIMRAALNNLLNPQKREDSFESLMKIGNILPGEGSPLEKLAYAITGHGGGGDNVWVELIKGFLPMAQQVLALWQQRLALEARAIEISQNGGRTRPAAERPPASPAPAARVTRMPAAAVTDPTMPEAAEAGDPTGAPPVPGNEGSDFELLSGEPSQLWIEARIARMIIAGADGDDICQWLWITDQRVVQTLAQYSLDQLLLAFRNPQSPLSVASDEARLPEILKTFLDTAAKVLAPNPDDEPGDGKQAVQ